MNNGLPFATIPEALVSLKSKNGYTNNFIASSINVEEPVYKEMESGRVTPSFDILLSLATLYDVTPDIFPMPHHIAVSNTGPNSHGGIYLNKSNYYNVTEKEVLSKIASKKEKEEN